jgi:hypothetical protein
MTTHTQYTSTVAIKEKAPAYLVLTTEYVARRSRACVSIGERMDQSALGEYGFSWSYVALVLEKQVRKNSDVGSKF